MRVVILITVVESLILMLWMIHWYHKRGRSKLATVHPPAVPAINRNNGQIQRR
ncbi:MAG TPA: hypothetical protein VKB05_01720 [Pyrinomonadaceae bacterium]|nr:hypothetical protein [Pyrinomonadaceae bacterium]